MFENKWVVFEKDFFVLKQAGSWFSSQLINVLKYLSREFVSSVCLFENSCGPGPISIQGQIFRGISDFTSGADQGLLSSSFLGVDECS